MEQKVINNTVEGIVENIVFANAENGYTVCEIDSEGELVTMVGVMPYLSVGESVRATGSWTVHPSFGRQLKVEYFEKSMPANQDAIYKYLSSGVIKGIGPVTASRIVDKFGDETLSVLENNPEWLCDIKGITRKAAEKIGEAFASQFGVRNIMMFLNKYFGAAVSVRIYKKYKAASEDIVKSNPYRLISEINGLGFERADRAAAELGFAHDCTERLEAGIHYVLSIAAYQSGHCYLPHTMLVSDCIRVLAVEQESVLSALLMCVSKKSVIKTGDDGESCYALPKIAEAEHYIASKLCLLNENQLPYRIEGVDSHIIDLEARKGITYHEKQKRAIRYSATFGISVITGGPGTGKTTVISAVLDIFDSLKISYMLAAPTGRAAKRMSVSSGRDAKTIHRMLEMAYEEDGEPVFAKNEDNPLPFKAIIIDEMSMVDTLLMDALLRAVKPDSILVLIGDADQLPSVGPGNVLNDIIKSGFFPVTRLEFIFRQASESLIVVNAHQINSGKCPALDVKNSDFFFMERNDPHEIQELIASLCNSRLPKAYGIDPFEDIQVITPTKKGELGTRELNKVLQAELNPKDRHKKEKQVRDLYFRENDKVMQTKNNYDLCWKKDNEEGTGIFNGDIGRIIEIRFQDEFFVIDFDGRICEYDFSLTDELEHAYAITVHKSQGSEYPVVIIPAARCPLPLMTRNLLYTAVTRAKDKLVTVGSRTIIAAMAKNNRKDIRFTNLFK